MCDCGCITLYTDCPFDLRMSQHVPMYPVSQVHKPSTGEQRPLVQQQVLEQFSPYFPVGHATTNSSQQITQKQTVSAAGLCLQTLPYLINSTHNLISYKI